MSTLSIDDLVNQAATAYTDRQARMAENEKAAKEADRAARQAYAEGVLQPLLDMNLTTEEQKAFGITITFKPPDRGGTIEETTIPFCTFAVGDTGIGGKIEFAPAEGPEFRNGYKASAPRWTVTASKRGYSETIWWGDGLDNLKTSLVLAVGRIASQVKEAEAER